MRCALAYRRKRCTLRSSVTRSPRRSAPCARRLRLASSSTRASQNACSLSSASSPSGSASARCAPPRTLSRPRSRRRPRHLAAPSMRRSRGAPGSASARRAAPRSAARARPPCRSARAPLEVPQSHQDVAALEGLARGHQTLARRTGLKCRQRAAEVAAVLGDEPAQRAIAPARCACVLVGPGAARAWPDLVGRPGARPRRGCRASARSPPWRARPRRRAAVREGAGGSTRGGPRPASNWPAQHQALHALQRGPDADVDVVGGGQHGERVARVLVSVTARADVVPGDPASQPLELRPSGSSLRRGQPHAAHQRLLGACSSIHSTSASQLRASKRWLR
jgi:hypothetical protein